MTEPANNSLEKQWLDACPVGLLLLDLEGTIRWLNPALEKMLGIPAGQLVGHTRDDLPLPAYSFLFDSDGVVRNPESVAEAQWLQRTSARVPSGEKNEFLLCSFQDISEQVRVRDVCDQLRQQVIELSLTDELTGLANRRALVNALTDQVTRSRRYENPLTLILVSVELGDEKTQVIREALDQTVVAVSHYLRDRLRWADIIGRYDHALFMLILPESDRQAANALIEKIRAESSAIELPDDLAGLPLALGFGVAEWGKGNDPRILIERAMDVMETPAWRSGASSNRI